MEIKRPSAIVDSMAAFFRRAAWGLMVMLLQDGTVPRRVQCDQSPEWLSLILMRWAAMNMCQVQNKTLSNANDAYLLLSLSNSGNNQQIFIGYIFFNGGRRETWS